MLVAAHGNSLRALLIILGEETPETINKAEMPTGVPLVFELENGKIGKKFFLEQRAGGIMEKLGKAFIGTTLSVALAATAGCARLGRAFNEPTPMASAPALTFCPVVLNEAEDKADGIRRDPVTHCPALKII